VIGGSVYFTGSRSAGRALFARLQPSGEATIDGFNFTEGSDSGYDLSSGPNGTVMLTAVAGGPRNKQSGDAVTARTID